MRVCGSPGAAEFTRERQMALKETEVGTTSTVTKADGDLNSRLLVHKSERQAPLPTSLA
jgi:hypothetical protein